MKSISTTGKDVSVEVLNLMQDEFVYIPVAQPPLKPLEDKWVEKATTPAEQGIYLTRVGDDWMWDFAAEQNALKLEQNKYD